MHKKEYPIRKEIRLTDYDYTQNGAYFITICIQNRCSILWDVGAIINRPHTETPMSEYGLIVDKYIQDIPQHYTGVFVDKYVVMPNHVHIIIRLDNYGEDGGRLIIAPTCISNVVQQLKRAVTREIGSSIWQKSFYEHIIRSEQDYLTIWQYIENNPAKWAEDQYYID